MLQHKHKCSRWSPFVTQCRQTPVFRENTTNQWTQGSVRKCIVLIVLLDTSQSDVVADSVPRTSWFLDISALTERVGNAAGLPDCSRILTKSCNFNQCCVGKTVLCSQARLACPPKTQSPATSFLASLFVQRAAMFRARNTNNIREQA